jgi:hypothetical protein
MKTISIKWSTDDILMTAQNMEINLTNDEADTILDELAENHDAELGICWAVIESYIQQYVDEREYERKKELMKYPFKEGNDYWTIEEGKVTWSCWDDVSEDWHDLNPHKKYFTTEQEAQDYLKRLN